MKAIDAIRWALQMTDQGTAAMVADLRGDAALSRPTRGAPGGDGNHPLWSLGHLCVIEGGLPGILFGEPNPVEHWKPLFATGTTPRSDAAGFPPFDEVVATFRSLRANTLRLLDRVGENGLDRPPKHVPPGFEDAMKMTGRTFLLLALHNMVHYGQIADARRVVGLKPML